MNCDEARPLIHGYADGELDVVRAMDVERHIHDCPACGRAFQCLRGLRDVVAEAPLYRRAPPALERRVRAALWAEAGLAESHETHGARRDDSHKASLETTPVRRFTLAGWRRVALAASVLLAVALAAAVGWRMARGPMGPPEQAVAREVVAGHVRSLLAEHLLDVPSSDRHTVRPWFNGKLDFAPDVRDFAADGYPLAGGRLDYLDGRPVAALVYRHGRHPINLFTWPAGGAAGDGAAGPERLLTVNGYRVAHWTAGAMTYWAVSDTGEDEMRQFVRLVRDSH